MSNLLVVFLVYNLVAFYCYQKSANHGYNTLNKSQRVSLLLIFIALSLFGSQSGDYLAYGELVEKAYNIISTTNASFDDYITHLDNQYNFLAYYMHGNYMAWRFVVFGLQFVILFWILKKIHFCDYKFAYLLVVISLFPMLVGRSSWGICLLTSCVIYFRYTDKRIYWIFTLLAIFSHKFAIVPIAISLLSFFKCNKRFIILILCIVPIISYIAGYIFNEIAILDTFQEGLTHSLEVYTGENVISTSLWGRSIGEMLIYIPSRLSIMLIVIVSVYKTTQKGVHVPSFIEGILNYMLGMFLCTLVMAFGNFGDGQLSIRFLDAMFLPAVFVFYYYRKVGIYSNRFSRFIAMCFLFSFEMKMVVQLYYNS